MSTNVVLFFGEMGSGKTHLGRQFALDFGMAFVEGDNFLPTNMRSRVAKFMPPTADQLKDLVLELSLRVPPLAKAAPIGLVVSQALYRNAHRLEVIEAWQNSGLTVDTMWVQTPLRQHMAQLYRRDKGLRWMAYCLASKPWFEKPTHAHQVVLNDR